MDDYHEKFALYYDLLYSDKDYSAECDGVESLIREHCAGARTILDLGCGTGTHALEMARRGYQVTGVDPSPYMIAQAVRKNADGCVAFVNGYVSDLPEVSYDVVAALFNVVNCLPDRQHMSDLFQQVASRMHAGSVFIFDCWNGLAVLQQRPETRFKKITHDGYEIWRIAQPSLDELSQMCELTYRVLVLQDGGKADEFDSSHRIRFYLPEEIGQQLRAGNLSTVARGSGLDRLRDARASDWIHTYVARRESGITDGSAYPAIGRQ